MPPPEQQTPTLGVGLPRLPALPAARPRLGPVAGQQPKPEPLRARAAIAIGDTTLPRVQLTEAPLLRIPPALHDPP